MTKLLKTLKNNLFLVAVVLGYALMFVIKPHLGVTAVSNSGYYMKEMLMIMPVIFVLTALLDTWVPKQIIMTYLGKESKIKGIVMSFILGSISAGPIYAAFPFCIMLHKKGASVKNIVIILSAWAVVKIPMLLNELKFLGFKFMVIRWVLTVIAIVIFSWIAAKLVKDKDLPADTEKEKAGLSLDQSACMGCSLCVRQYPELFEMRGKKAVVKDHEFQADEDRLQKVIASCPVQAIDCHTE